MPTALLILSALLLLTPSAGATDLHQVALKAGVSRIDITPEVLVALDGYQDPENRISEGIHDRLYARIFAFQGGPRKIVLVSCDITSFMFAQYFQDILQNKFSLRPDELFLCATHTHSAPHLSLNRTYPHPNNFAYTAILRARLVEGVAVALKALAPARIALGRGRSSVGVNRRKTMPDGEIHMAPNPEGPSDPEVLALAITNRDGRPVGALFNYACHSRSLRGSNRLITGDVFGLSQQYVERAFRGNFVAGAFAGASGDIDPEYVVDGFGGGPENSQEQPVRLGNLLGETVLRAIGQATALNESRGIRSASERVMLPGKTAGNARPVQVIAARLGDVAFLGLDCEALVEVGLAIKASSPFRNTFILTVCNGWSGYLPPGQRYVEGGYEVNRSGFGPGAADELVQRCVRLLESLR